MQKINKYINITNWVSTPVCHINCLFRTLCIITETTLRVYRIFYFVTYLGKTTKYTSCVCVVK